MLLVCIFFRGCYKGFPASCDAILEELVDVHLTLVNGAIARVARDS